MSMQTESWLREQLDQDAPPSDLELDGRAILSAGHRRRRRQRLTAAVPVAAAAVVVGAGLWAADLLPEPVQQALPAAPAPASDCLRLAPGTGEHAGEGSGTTTTVLSDPTPLALASWTEADGTRVWIVRSAGDCGLGIAPDAVSLAYVSQEPDRQPTLHGYRDVREDVTVWGGTVLGGSEGHDAVAIVPVTASELHAVGGGEVGELVPVPDDAGHPVAQVARVSDAGPHGGEVAALLWKGEGETFFTSSWLQDDLLAVWLQKETADPTWELGPPPAVGAQVPQLARSETDGRWWLWAGTHEVAGPVDPPDGPWALRLVGDEVSALVGWLPEGTETLLVDGMPSSMLPLTTVVGQDLPGLEPFAADPYSSVQEAVAVDGNGRQTPLTLIDVDLEPPGR